MKMAQTYGASSRSNLAARTFCLYWRFRESHPWNIEEFNERPRAYNRFFNLLERGIEARFQTRTSSDEQQLMEIRREGFPVECAYSN